MRDRRRHPAGDMGRCNSKMIRVGHATISVCCELPYPSTGRSASARRACRLGSAWCAGGLTPGFALRIGVSFTRTSQAFARFNPEIRTGVAELLEHSVRRPRPRVRRVVVNPLPHRMGVVRRPTVEPCPTQGTWRLWPTLAEALYHEACLLLIPRSMDTRVRGALVLLFARVVRREKACRPFF